MRPRYALLYISIGIALGLCLHLAGNAPDAASGRAGPAFPIASTDTAYT